MLHLVPATRQHEDCQSNVGDSLSLNQTSLMMILCDMNSDPLCNGASEKIEVWRTFGKVRDVKDFVVVDGGDGVECPRECGRKVLVDLNLQATSLSSNATAFRTAVVGIS